MCITGNISKYMCVWHSLEYLAEGLLAKMSSKNIFNTFEELLLYAEFEF